MFGEVCDVGLISGVSILFCEINGDILLVNFVSLLLEIKIEVYMWFVSLIGVFFY